MSKLAGIIKKIEIDDFDTYTLRNYFQNNFPKTSKALQILDDEYMKAKRRKGFNLVPRDSKKNGIIYYARFSYNGKMLPTKFNTHTGNIIEAEQYAIKNKERLIEQYLAKKDGRVYKFLTEFYKKETNIPEVNILTERIRRKYEVKINKYFIPFLQQEKIINFIQIKKTTLIKYQDYLLSGKIKSIKDNNIKETPVKPQTVNSYMKPVNKIFAYLTRKGEITDNIAKMVEYLPVNNRDLKIRGCHELDKLKGVFNKRWKDDLSCLLSLIIYTTGMRNCEIRRINLEDIIKIKDCRFLKVNESKTRNGIRIVPLHDFVYRKILIFAQKQKKNIIFENLTNKKYEKACFQANIYLAKMLNISIEKIKEENITFYSGRHFYKTLLNAEGLGENIEEIFMGHKVSGNVKQSYNHRDKQGKERLAKKAKQVFSIFDRCIFQTVRKNPHGRRGAGVQPPCA